jgi:hypothetical protein
MVTATHNDDPMSGNILRMPAEAVSRPVPDRNEIERSLKLFITLGSVVEIRGLEVTSQDFKRPHAEYGYFDSLDKATSAALKLGRTDGSVYITLNPVSPDLLARANNRIKVGERASTTSDTHIVRRQFVLLDFDPERPSGISSTDAEKEAARQKALEVRQHLRDLEWPDPVFSDSGNGYHLLYRVDLPNDTESADLVRSLLLVLDALHGDEAVKIDTAVYNAARIVKPELCTRGAFRTTAALG